MSPQTVNASYDATLNEMTFPAGILQPPYFDPAADPAANYGGIGAVIGHEMIHGFDDEGRKYDGAGVLSAWWTDADAKEFTARAAVLGRKGAPTIEGRTGDQRFFLGYAQSWRHKSTDDAIRQLIVANPHAPEQY